jgi:exopolysaccharide biosynthesis protein
LAYCVERNRLLVGLQEHGTTPGMKISQLAYDLLNLGFDDAVFLDGSDSATLMVDGKMIVSPAERKDNAIVVGVGFSR